MPEYRVLAGTHRTEDGEVAEPGDTVELSEEVRQQFAFEKFERVETDDETIVSDEPTDADEDDESESVEAEEAEDDGDDEDGELETADVDDIIPHDEYRLLSRMAADYNGDEVHGAMAGDDIVEFLETLTVPEVQELKRQAEASLAE
jgi:hypothetical protein